MASSAVRQHQLAEPDPKDLRQVLSRPTVALAVDCQESFRPCLQRFEAVEPLRQVLAAARERAAGTVYTRHGHEDVTKEDPRLGREDGGVLCRFWEDWIERGSDTWQILPELAPRQGDVVVDKKRYDAFAGSELEHVLRKEKGAETLLVGGAMSQFCVETTARQAFVRDFNVVLLSDCSGTSSKAHHNATLKNFASGFGVVASSSDVLSLLTSHQ